MNSKNQFRPNAKLTIGLISFIAVCFLAAAIGGLATSSSVGGWYQELNKPSWNPPDWIFGPVWSTLYLLMGVAAWVVWKIAGFKQAQHAMIWFAIQLLLNVFWSILFFGLQQPGLAVIEIAFLWASIAITIVLFLRHSKLAAGLLVPYLMWVTFAAYLNYTLWVLNRVV